jgi:hypothetical protein
MAAAAVMPPDTSKIRVSNAVVTELGLASHPRIDPIVVLRFE